MRRILDILCTKQRLIGAWGITNNVDAVCHWWKKVMFWCIFEELCPNLGLRLLLLRIWNWPKGIFRVSYFTHKWNGYLISWMVHMWLFDSRIIIAFQLNLGMYSNKLSTKNWLHFFLNTTCIFGAHRHFPLSSIHVFSNLFANEISGSLILLILYFFPELSIIQYIFFRVDLLWLLFIFFSWSL